MRGRPWAPGGAGVSDDAVPLSWPQVLATLMSGRDLDGSWAAWAMDQIMAGEATPVQVAGFLVALRTKGESAVELRALADTMLAHAVPIEVPGPSLDIVGTGGDRAFTVNISTTAAVVCAATGLRVVKHGNRAASSASGSADVLEALGIDLGLAPDRVAQVADEAGITFCFAQAFHPAMRHAGVARRELGVGTAFNFLGPLTNPARPTYSAIGCADSRMAALMADVLADRGASAAVFRGDDGLDEVTITTTTSVAWVRGGRITRHVLDPARLGVELAPIESLRGADAAHNAGAMRAVFAGERGSIRDAVLLNAGLALALAQPEVGSAADGHPESAVEFHDAVARGMQVAAEAIDSGAASRTLEGWAAATRRSSPGG